MTETRNNRKVAPGSRNQAQLSSLGFAGYFHGVRYQTVDVARAIDFYTRQLGFTLEHAQLPEFAAVSFGPLSILLSGPGASGSRRMPTGQTQEPGGWNRVVLRVRDLASSVEGLKQAGAVFGTRWNPGQAANKSSSWIPMATQSNLFEPAQRKHYDED